jgi:hypothetical protein
MALLYDGTDDYTLIGDHAALTLPAGDWSIGMWIKLLSNAGAGWHCIAYWAGGTALLYWRFAGEDHASAANKLYFSVVDGDGTSRNTISDNTVGQSRAWQHLCVVRSGGSITQYVNGVANGSTISTDFDAVNPSGPLYLGTYGGGGYWLHAQCAEFAKWDRALSSDERAAQIAGAPASLFAEELAWSLPMVAGAQSDFARLSVTDYSSGVVEAPKVFCAGGPRVVRAAPAGVRPRSVFYSPVFHPRSIHAA